MLFLCESEKYCSFCHLWTEWLTCRMCQHSMFLALWKGIPASICCAPLHIKYKSQVTTIFISVWGKGKPSWKKYLSSFTFKLKKDKVISGIIQQGYYNTAFLYFIYVKLCNKSNNSNLLVQKCNVSYKLLLESPTSAF